MVTDPTLCPECGHKMICGRNTEGHVDVWCGSPACGFMMSGQAYLLKLFNGQMSDRTHKAGIIDAEAQQRAVLKARMSGVGVPR